MKYLLTLAICLLFINCSNSNTDHLIIQEIDSVPYNLEEKIVNDFKSIGYSDSEKQIQKAYCYEGDPNSGFIVTSKIPMTKSQFAYELEQMAKVAYLIK